MNRWPSARSVVLPLSLLAAAFCHAGWRIESAAVDAHGADTATQIRAVGANAAGHVDRAQLMRDVTTLASPAFEGRRTGTPGGTKAREWIAQQFASLKLTPANGSDFAQPFTFTTRAVAATLPGGRPYGTEYKAVNLVGRIGGRDPDARTIVITAHYDHVGIQDGVLYPGADDNASGVAALLAVVRHFLATQPRHPLVLAALDGEEQGQHGARALIASNLVPRGRVGLNVNLDMVSRSNANEIYAAGPYHSPWETPVLLDVQTRASVKILFGHDRPPRAGGGLEDWTHSSDHGPFHDAGVPFVYFGVEDHADYHKPSDTADRIDPRFFGDVADMIVEAVRTFDQRLE